MWRRNRIARVNRRKKGSHGLNRLFLQILAYMESLRRLITQKLFLCTMDYSEWGEKYLELGKPNNGGTKIFLCQDMSTNPEIMKYQWELLLQSYWN